VVAPGVAPVVDRLPRLAARCDEARLHRGRHQLVVQPLCDQHRLRPRPGGRVLGQPLAQRAAGGWRREDAAADGRRFERGEPGTAAREAAGRDVARHQRRPAACVVIELHVAIRVAVGLQQVRRGDAADGRVLHGGHQRRQVARRGERGDAGQRHVGRVAGCEGAGPQRSVAALRMAPGDGAIGQRHAHHLPRGPHRIERGAGLAGADQVGVDAGGAQAHVVGGDPDPALVEQRLQRGHVGERIAQQRRRTAAHDSGAAVRPRDHRARAGGYGARDHHDGAGEGGRTVVTRGRVEDAPRDRAFGHAAGEGLLAQQRAGAEGDAVGGGVEGVGGGGEGEVPGCENEQEREQRRGRQGDQKGTWHMAHGGRFCGRGRATLAAPRREPGSRLASRKIPA
jgi:hypothetical protein